MPIGVSLGELARLRARTYEIYGCLFLAPTAERFAGLEADARELREQSDVVGTFPFYRTWDGVLEAVETLDAGSRRRLEGDHVRLLLAGGPHTGCPPYESEYVDPSRRAHGFVAAELEQVSSSTGIDLSASLAAELPDHVTPELEFMSRLCEEEERHWSAARLTMAKTYLAHERSFLDRHLARWLPDFLRCLRAADRQPGFYARLAEATHAFVAHDRDLVGALLGAGPSVAPGSHRPPEATR